MRRFEPIMYFSPKMQEACHDTKEWNLELAINEDRIDIWLHGFVGDDFTGTDSASIGKVLAENPAKDIRLRVNSPGGFAYDGIAIFNQILSHDGNTEGLISGRAGSAASLAVIACDIVKCHAGAIFQPHYSIVQAVGHQAQIRDALAVQEQLDMDMERLYAARSGQSIEKVRQDLEGPNGDGTVFGADAALAAGYVDEVLATPGPPENKSRETAAAAMMSRVRAQASLWDWA